MNGGCCFYFWGGISLFFLYADCLACSPLPVKERAMAYRRAGIDVHKKMLAVVVADVECEGEYEFERRRFGSNPEQLQRLSEWLIEQQVEEVVMESTAQYWQPVW